jgi:hypothetical protein
MYFYGKPWQTCGSRHSYVNSKRCVPCRRKYIVRNTFVTVTNTLIRPVRDTVMTLGNSLIETAETASDEKLHK